MTPQSARKTSLSLVFVYFLFTCYSQIAGAAYSKPEAKPGSSLETGKAFAVFVAAFNPKTGAAVGGVAGTAFFVTGHRAISAYHVLQPKTFQPRPGFPSVQVWLVHENEPAIEISGADITYLPGRDQSIIDLGKSHGVTDEFVFATIEAPDASMSTAGEILSEGFRVNSTGPILAIDRSGLRLAILSVPRLERIEAKGALLGETSVSLKSNDIDMKSTPCFQLSYPPVVGLSGGPVVSQGRVIGMNSFADPATRARTWAVVLQKDIGAGQR